MISETLEVLKCAISDQEHFLIEPIPLIKCGHSICKKCVPNDDLKEFECKLCGLVSKQDFNDTQASQGTQQLLKMCLGDIFQILKEETTIKLNELIGMLTIMWFKWNSFGLNFNSISENIKEKSGLLEVKFKYIREEIDIRVESLVIQVHEMGHRMRENVKESEKEVLK